MNSYIKLIQAFQQTFVEFLSAAGSTQQGLTQFSRALRAIHKKLLGTFFAGPMKHFSTETKKMDDLRFPRRGG